MQSLMKLIIPLLFIVILLTEAKAQYPKLIVQLKDKANNTFSLNNASQFLSARAIQRRTRYNIPIDSADLPVTQRYIDSLRLAGNVTVLSTSKWLNQVLLQSTDQNAINKIRSFPFVRLVQSIGLRTTDNPVIEKFKEEVKPLERSIQISQQKIAADYYDYGNSFAQVHIHEGEFLHNKGYRGENMQITILDAGFLQYKTITAFDSIRINGQVLGERDFVAFDNSVNEDDSHGMYCLSILSANWPGKMVGTAPKSKYWLVRTENAATEYPIEEHNWVAGAEFADSTGSDMISSSLGYSEFDDPSFNHTYNDFYKNTTMVSRGATIAAKKGMIVMNSAGNEGGNNWKYIIFPADADSVCAVGAVNASGVIAGFSSYGYPGKVKPNIVSVGSGTVIAGLNNQPSSGNGTSFSNPNVAGLVACLWQAFPNFNNMKILDAVYRSSDRYNTPDNRYGFGIPNFRTAFQLLKKDQNIALYGNQTLFAAPDPFTSQIDVTYIGQTTGSAKLEFLNSASQIVGTQNLTVEKEEVYKYTFSNLNILPPGNYTIKYTDSLSTKSITVQKISLVKDWLVALPNPFQNNLSVYLKAPATGQADVRLVDAKGSIIETMTLQVNENEIRNISFTKVRQLTRGVYFVEYMSKGVKRTIKLVKL
jgi:serine protease AprX